MLISVRPLPAAKVSVLRRAFAADEEGDFLEFAFGVVEPDHVGGWVALQPFRAASQGRVVWFSLRAGVAVVAWASLIVEFKVFAEHVEQMFLQPHDQRVDPCVEEHIGAFDPHLRRVARREILDVDRRGDDGTWDAEAFADMALHLCAEDHLWAELFDPGFDFEIIFGDQRLDVKVFGQASDRAGHFAVVATKAHHLEPHLVTGDAGGGAATWVPSPKTKTRLPVRYVLSTELEYQGRRRRSVLR